MRATTSDDRVRQLERRFRESGEAADEAQLLLERLRGGSLTDRRRLVLGAVLGSEGAAAALGEEDQSGRLEDVRWLVHPDWTKQKGCPRSKQGGKWFYDPLEVYRWVEPRPIRKHLADPVLALVRACHRLEAVGSLRAALAAVRLVLPTWEERAPTSKLCREIVEATERWLVCPCDRHHETLSDLAVAFEEQMGREFSRDLGSPAEQAYVAAGRLAEAVTRTTDQFGHEGKAAEAVRSALASVFLGDSEGDHARTAEKLRVAIGEELAPWLLGHGDPIAARVGSVRPPRKKRAQPEPPPPRPEARNEPLAPAERQRLAKAIKKHRLEHLSETILSHACPCVALTPRRFRGEPPLGASRTGGEPDLPKGTDWPREGDQLLSFLAQLDLAELPAIPGLPRRGLLSFFLGDDEAAGSAGHRVLFAPSTKGLVRLSPPAGATFLSENYEDLEPRALRAVRTISVPGGSSPQILALDLPDDEASRYEALEASFRPPSVERTPPSQLLGHPDCVLGHAIEGAAVILGLGRSQAGGAWQRKHAREVAAEAAEWRLLLELQSDLGSNLCFWDAGILQFVIRRDALANLDFSNLFAAIGTS